MADIQRLTGPPRSGSVDTLEPRAQLSQGGAGAEAEEGEGTVAGRRGLRGGRVGCEGEQQADEASAPGTGPIHRQILT